MGGVKSLFGVINKMVPVKQLVGNKNFHMNGDFVEDFLQNSIGKNSYKLFAIFSLDFERDKKLLNLMEDNWSALSEKSGEDFAVLAYDRETIQNSLKKQSQQFIKDLAEQKNQKISTEEAGILLFTLKEENNIQKIDFCTYVTISTKDDKELTNTLYSMFEQINECLINLEVDSKDFESQIVEILKINEKISFVVLTKVFHKYEEKLHYLMPYIGIGLSIYSLQ